MLVSWPEAWPYFIMLAIVRRNHSQRQCCTKNFVSQHLHGSLQTLTTSQVYWNLASLTGLQTCVSGALGISFTHSQPVARTKNCTLMTGGCYATTNQPSDLCDCFYCKLAVEPVVCVLMTLAYTHPIPSSSYEISNQAGLCCHFWLVVPEQQCLPKLALLL